MTPVEASSEWPTTVPWGAPASSGVSVDLTSPSLATCPLILLSFGMSPHSLPPVQAAPPSILFVLAIWNVMPGQPGLAGSRKSQVPMLIPCAQTGLAPLAKRSEAAKHKLREV